MKIINRYIYIRLMFGWILVFLITSALFSILELLGQFNDIGEGSYQIYDAFLYVIYTLPGRILDLAAVSSLLGTIVALGTLANTDELLILRACGFSVFRIARIVLSAGTVIMIGALFLSQFIVPPMERKAKIDRDIALTGAGSMLPTGGFWTRDQDRFINVRSSNSGGIFFDVSIYEFDKDGKPTSFINTQEANIKSGGKWMGKDVRQVTFSDQSLTDKKIPSMLFDIFLNTKQVEILSITPSMLSLDELYQYINVLRKSGQNADQFILAMWQKTTLPIKIAALMFFSLPFVFGSSRDANPGRRVTLGAIFGISYYYFDHALGYTGLLIGLHPAITTLLPLSIIFLMTTWLLLRVP